MNGEMPDPGPYSLKWSFAGSGRVVGKPEVEILGPSVRLAPDDLGQTINQHFLRYNFRPKTEWPAKQKSTERVQ